MPVSNLDGFLDTLRKSGLVEETTLQQYLAWLRANEGVADDPRRLAHCMVRDAVLSQFQADQLVNGKWRGFHVAKYRVLEKIGIGGMGQVYLAEHKYMKNRVALKVLPRSKSTDPSSLERFYREAKAGAAMDHSNIVRAFDIDFDQQSDLHYLVMEYVDGVSMQDLCKLKGRMPAERAANYIYQAAQGLVHAHAQGLIHRDIKPSNILVDRQGMIKILDMGLARFFNDDQDMITKKYDESVLGTADYLAPEQAVDSHAVDIRADIYSLGCTLYYMLAGAPPFGEGSVAQKLIWHQTRRPKSIKEHRPDLPDDIVAVLEKMMAKSPAERYQTTQEVIDALQSYGSLQIPPPAEDELPKLSPLARMMPDAKRPAGELTFSAADRGPAGRQPAPAWGAETADEEVHDLAVEQRLDPSLSPTKRTLESNRETPAPTRPEKLGRSGPNRFGSAPMAGAPPGSSPQHRPLRASVTPAEGVPAPVHRPASRSRPPQFEARKPDAEPLSPFAEQLKNYTWLWMPLAIGIVVVLVAVNAFLLLRAAW
jgi:serine/threonine protein kinase